MTAVRTDGWPARNRTAPALGWRLGAIGLFLGLPLGAVAMAAFGLVTSLNAADRANHAEDTAHTLIHGLDRKPGRVAPPLDTTPLYLASASPSLAQAELQALVSKRIEAAGGRLQQLQPLEAAEGDPPGRVAAEIGFVAGNGGLLDVLQGIETGLPILTVPRLEIRVDAPADGSGDTGDGLRIVMTVQGTWKVPTP